MGEGFFEGMDYEVYRRITALNYSSLKHMGRSPMCFRYHIDNPTPSTSSQSLGHAVHKMILEPERVGDFAIWGDHEDEKVRRGKVWESFCAEHRESEIITRAERDHMVGISVAVRRNPVVMKYLKTGKSELSMVWFDKAAHRRFKGRIDWLTEIDGQPVIVDLKTTRDCTAYRFGGDAHKMCYHYQFAMYADGFYYLTKQLPRVVVIAVENKPPYESAVFTVPDDVLSQGHTEYMRLVQMLQDCEKRGQWPPALEMESELLLPAYAFGDTGEDLTELELIA